MGCADSKLPNNTWATVYNCKPRANESRYSIDIPNKLATPCKYSCHSVLSMCAVMEQPSREKVEVKVDGHAGVCVVKSEGMSRRQRVRCCLHVTAVHLRRALWGVITVLCICSSWSGSTQLAKLTFRQLNVPFTLTWFSTSWNCVMFPFYYLGHLCCSKDRQTPRQRFRFEALKNQHNQPDL